ncbi:hypothetical protein AN958_04703 [Leucoagaricus sp. SymC.cos]|nr:hypothetical protein AN958_04703 [Leucoagaricus sp. SymC.cos]
MPSLPDHIHRLAAITKNISQIVPNSTPADSSPGPFTSAILCSHLGDLIRDVDPSELGLFSLVQPQRAAVQERPVEIERVNFHGATPLRRPNPRHDDASRARDFDPELYAEAALKYLDRYKLVRPMPRAQAQLQAILDRIPVLRQSIDDLTDSLYQLEQTRSSTEPDYKHQLAEEERRIHDLRTKLAELNNKRAALTKAKKSHLDLAENKAAARKPLAPKKSSAEEDEFWNTPAASARTFKFTSDNLLMDEKADFRDISAISFSASPVTSKTTSNFFTSTIMDLPLENPKHQLFQTSDSLPDTGTPSKESHTELSDIPPLPSQGVAHQDTPDLDMEVVEPTPAQTEEVAGNNDSGISVTSEVELITNKIWSVMADLVIAAATTKGVDIRDKPSTREIIYYLEHLQDFTPSDELSTNTTSGAPTSQQVLIATLLVGLLASSAEHSLPLTKVKELLTTRTDGTAQPNSSRIVYGCVAKRLLKIDRTGGEQVVRFDV